MSGLDYYKSASLFEIDGCIDLQAGAIIIPRDNNNKPTNFGENFFVVGYSRYRHIILDVITGQFWPKNLENLATSATILSWFHKKILLFQL